MRGHFVKRAEASSARPRAVEVVEAEDQDEVGAARSESVFDAGLDGQGRADGVDSGGDGAAVVVEGGGRVEGLEGAAELAMKGSGDGEGFQILADVAVAVAFPFRGEIGGD